jgi:hypothetical protein
MDTSITYSAAALALVVGKLSYAHVKLWWNAKKLTDVYIGRATEVQVDFETVAEEQADAFAEALAVDPIKSVRRHKGIFRHYLVNTGKLKFGCPTRNEANLQVVRKYLFDICKDHGLVARHIVECLDVATELVFVPSRSELLALATSHTELSKIRAKVKRDLKGISPTIA